MTRVKTDSRRLLTAVELEIMTALWKLGEGTVSRVLDQLPRPRKPAYTSVSTILRILEQKGWVGSRKEGRGHVYVPRIPRESYEATSLRHLIDGVFEGEPVSLVRRLLLIDEALSPADLRALRELLDGKKRSR